MITSPLDTRRRALDGDFENVTLSFGHSIWPLLTHEMSTYRKAYSFGVFAGNQQSQAYGIAMGNYFAGHNYGVEVGYADLGSVNRYGGSTKVDGINLSLIGRLPISASFNLLGKVGTTYSRTDVSTNAANSNLAGSERGFDWSYGVGAEYRLTPQWSATLQYAEHFVKYPATGNERVSSTTLGARFYF